MESEEIRTKCMPFIPRQGQRILLILVTVNILILWFIYRQSSLILYSELQAGKEQDKTLFRAIYNVPLFHIPLTDTKDMAPFYTTVNSNTWCFRGGIDFIESNKRKKCVCASQWFGFDCGIPASVWKSSFLQEGKNAGVEIRRRDKPRRIIISLVVDDEFDLLDINVHNSFPVADLILAVEENNHHPSVLDLFKQGFLAAMQSKVLPLQVKQSVLYKNINEWTMLMLNELWSVGWKRLSDFRPDDIFVFAHVSSLISKDVLLFLKLYDGYPEPFYFNVRPLLFKFWQEIKDNNTNKFVPFEPSGCSFQFLSSMCNYEVWQFFTSKCNENLEHKVSFEKNHWHIKDWIIGDIDTPSGWQCNLCCRSNCYQRHTKSREWVIETVSASLFNSENVNVSVIEQFLQQKNINKNLAVAKISTDDPSFAPKYIIDNREKYSYLIN